MRYGPSWFLRMLVAVVVIGVLMSLAFGAGLAADGGSASTADGHYYQPCFRLFGCLFGLFLLIGIIGLIGCAFRGPRPHYYAGPGWHRYGRRWRDWSDEDWRCQLDAELADWHSRAHGQGGSSEPASPAPETPKGNKSK
jgi:hypothetical protein